MNAVTLEDENIITNPKDPIIAIETTPPKNEHINPISTAFCAYGNTIGQSSAGFEFGTNLLDIPLNAGTISNSELKKSASTIPYFLFNIDIIFNFTFSFISLSSGFSSSKVKFKSKYNSLLSSFLISLSEEAPPSQRSRAESPP